MKKTRILTAAALFILAAAIVTIAVIYHSDAYRDRQALSELPHEQDAEDGAVEGAAHDGGSPDGQGPAAGGGPEAGGSPEGQLSGDSGQADGGAEEAEEPEVPELRFIAVGDIMLGRGEIGRAHV